MNCPKCNAPIPDGSTFCSACGNSLTPNQAPNQNPYQGGPGPQAASGLTPNVAALISYVLGWVTGLIMFFVEKDKFVKFHAMQSIILFGSLSVLYWLIGFIFGMVGIYSFGFAFALLGIINLALGVLSLVLWIVLMMKAYKGEKFKLPVIGDMADKIVNK